MVQAILHSLYNFFLTKKILLILTGHFNINTCVIGVELRIS